MDKSGLGLVSFAVQTVTGGGGFFLACEDLGRMVDYSFPASTFFLLKWSVLAHS